MTGLLLHGVTLWNKLFRRITEDGADVRITENGTDHRITEDA